MHEGAALWLIPRFMTGQAQHALNTRLAPSAHSSSAGKLTTYCQVIQYLLQTYASDEEIARADAEIKRFVLNNQPTSMYKLYTIVPADAEQSTPKRISLASSLKGYMKASVDTYERIGQMVTRKILTSSLALPIRLASLLTHQNPKRCLQLVRPALHRPTPAVIRIAVSLRRPR